MTQTSAHSFSSSDSSISSQQNLLSPDQRRLCILEADWEMGLCRFARDLKKSGIYTRKVAFHAADHFYQLRGIPVDPFRGTIDEWKTWFTQYIEDQQINSILVYNDCRQYNQIAIEIMEERAAAGNIAEVFIVEQGLIRPLHVTAYCPDDFQPSDLSALWNQHLRGEIELSPRNFPQQQRRVSTPIKYLKMTGFGLIAALGKFAYPHYGDQNRVSAIYHFMSGLRSLLRYCYASDDKKWNDLVTGKLYKKYFFFPLQVAHDVQILQRSPYATILEAFEEVVSSFEKNAPSDAILLVKIHPVDRGFRCYDRLIRQYKARLGSQRIHLIDRVDLGTILLHARGVVTVNSTVGLTALRHGTAVKTLGAAIYDLPELTYQGELNSFWQDITDPDQDRVQEFVTLLESTIQGRGSLARKCFANDTNTGIMWAESFARRLNLPC